MILESKEVTDPCKSIMNLITSSPLLLARKTELDKLKPESLNRLTEHVNTIII